MSLIEEALRRLKDPLIPTEPKGTQASPPTPASETTPAHSWSTTASPSATPMPAKQATNVLVVTAVAVLALSALLVGGGIWWLKRTLAERPVAKRPSLTAAPASTPSGRAPAVRASQADAPQEEFTLNGTVEGLGEPYAVINGTVVGIGERIGEATVLAIANGVVKVRRADGSEFTLNVPR